MRATARTKHQQAPIARDSLPGFEPRHSTTPVRRRCRLGDKDLLAEIPVDPYDGKPLRYRLLDDGAVVYSVALDLIDQQGKLNIQAGHGEPGDLGIRLWNPENRRLAAPPMRPELLPFPIDPDDPNQIPPGGFPPFPSFP